MPVVISNQIKSKWHTIRYDVSDQLEPLSSGYPARLEQMFGSIGVDIQLNWSTYSAQLDPLSSGYPLDKVSN